MRGHPLAAVDDDVFGPDAALQHSHLGVIPSPSEQSGRLDAEVADPLLVVVHDAEAVLLQEPLVLFFEFLQKGTRGNKNTTSFPPEGVHAEAGRPASPLWTSASWLPIGP